MRQAGRFEPLVREHLINREATFPKSSVPRISAAGHARRALTAIEATGRRCEHAGANHFEISESFLQDRPFRRGNRGRRKCLAFAVAGSSGRTLVTYRGATPEGGALSLPLRLDISPHGNAGADETISRSPDLGRG